jgi:hypothetical protein
MFMGTTLAEFYFIVLEVQSVGDGISPRLPVVSIFSIVERAVVRPKGVGWRKK